MVMFEGVKCPACKQTFCFTLDENGDEAASSPDNGIEFCPHCRTQLFSKKQPYWQRLVLGPVMLAVVISSSGKMIEAVSPLMGDYSEAFVIVLYAVVWMLISYCLGPQGYRIADK